MHFTTKATLSALLVSSLNFSALAAPVDEPITLTRRAPLKYAKLAKAGDHEGALANVYAAADVRWNTPAAIHVKLGVTNVDAGSDDVYASYEVIYADGDKWESSQVRNNKGSGTYMEEPDFSLLKKEGVDVKGVKVTACVDDWGPNSCYQGTTLYIS